MNDNHITLRTKYASTTKEIPGYDGFMNGLMSIVKAGAMDTPTGDKLRDYVLNFVKNNSLSTFNHYEDNTYVRNIIGRDPSGWEAIVMSWKKGSRTAIHTHPQFASYTFADGEFLVEIFEPCEGGIKLVNKLTVNNQMGLYAIGEEGKFTNHIHRLTCLSESAHSLHVYSSDALNGFNLDDERIFE